MSKETGQLAYEAYCRVMVGMGVWERSLVDPWRSLSVNVQDAWRAAAHEVIQKGWKEAAWPVTRTSRAL